MKDLLKTYAPLAALAIGAFGYWSFGQVSILKQSLEAMREQNVNLIIGFTNNCKSLYEQEGLTTISLEKKEEYDAQPHSQRTEEEDSSTSESP